MATEREVPEPTDRTSVVVRRIFSITGLVPVGGFLLVHIYTNTYALLGREEFNEKVADIQKLPYLPIVELGVVLLPLLVHAVLGFLIVSRAERDAKGQARSWLLTLQRGTGALALAFIGFHLWEYWVQKQLGRMPWESFYTELGNNLSEPWRLALYSVGITSVVFHFAYGIWSFAVGWSRTLSGAAQRRLGVACAVLGLALWVLCMNIVLRFSTGAALLPVGTEEPPPADGIVATARASGMRLPFGRPAEVE